MFQICFNNHVHPYLREMMHFSSLGGPEIKMCFLKKKGEAGRFMDKIGLH